MEIGILGGGISGVALHHFLRRSSEVLEAADQPGGLCRTYWKQGFGYDLGGHILFSKNQAINQLVDQLLGNNVNQCRRANKVLFKGRYVKYPFENDLAALDKEDCYECLIEYLKADYPKPQNFEEWMYHCFGRGITEKYLLPYNRKIWKTEPREMGVEWVERIPRPPMEDVVRSALGFETEGYTHQLFFRYPHQGGVQALVTALIDDAAKVRCNFPVRRIRRNGGKWTVSNGQEDRDYDEIVVAFPIHEAAKCFDSTPAAVRDALERLRYNSLYVAMIGLNDETLMDKSAIYLPDPEILPHRVCFMGFFSKTMVPQGHSSLIAEITCPPGGEIDRAGKDWVLERAIGDLDRAGVIRRENVVATDIRRVEYAYPVYNLDYARSVRTVREYYASIGVHLLGRFAEFDYINSDECLRRAVDLAERLNQAKR